MTIFFSGRSSHYGLHDSAKLYLPEELNVKKMHVMFLEANNGISVSYETYRTIFCKDFNIAFGYPRTDTCSACDEFTAKSKSLESEKNGTNDPIRTALLDHDILKLYTENKLHKLKASTFYERKRIARILSRNARNATEAVCLDYGKNLSVPNIQTNDAYYKRQLSEYVFNIHVLGSSRSIFYLYPETEGKKGSDNVCSLLHHFVYNFMSDGTKHLEIFCDSCSGQNKNFTMFRFLHHLVHIEKKLESIKITFPIRGHSYLECDKNMGLVKTTTRTEVPEDWLQIFKDARQKPMPFDVVEVDRSFFRSWTTHFETIYAKKSTFPARPIKELKITKTDTKILFRSTYNGMWEKVSIAGRKKRSHVNLQEKEFILPGFAYEDALPISAEKFKDLQALKKFCSPEAAEYFTNIKHT